MEDVHTLWAGSCAKTNFFHVGVMTITSCDSKKQVKPSFTYYQPRGLAERKVKIPKILSYAEISTELASKLA